MRFLRTKKVIILFLMPTFLLGFYIWYRSYSNVTPIRLAIHEWPGFAPAVYAETLGLYRKYDVPIELTFATGTAQGEELFLNEKVDGITTVLPDLILLRAGGSHAQVLLFTDSSEDADALIAQAKFASVPQLKGQTIGIDRLNSFSHVFVLKILEKYGLTERDVFFQVVPSELVTVALQNNEVQAAHAWDPGLGIALAQGFKKIATTKEVPGVILDGIVFREDLLRKNPEIFKRFLKAFYEAQEKMLDNPLAAAQAMQSFFKNNPKAFAESFNEIKFIGYEEHKRRMNPKSVDSFQKEALNVNEFYLKRGQTTEGNIYEDAIATGLSL